MKMHTAPTVTKSDLKALCLNGTLNGFFRVSDEDYHSGPGISSSGICDFLRSPAHYYAARHGQKKSTPAMDFGTQVHEYLLQPARFNSRYEIEPKGINGPKNRNPWKGMWDDFKAKCQASGREPLDRATFDDIEGIASAVCNHSSGRALLEGAEREIAAYVQDPETNVVRKAKADIALPWGLADLKTTDDARKESFVRTIRAFHYHVKAAWYLDVFNALNERKMDSFIWIAAEKKPPYGVCCYAASTSMITIGRGIYESALKMFSGCLKTNTWPCYSGAIEPIELPDFFYREYEKENI